MIRRFYERVNRSDGKRDIPRVTAAYGGELVVASASGREFTYVVDALHSTWKVAGRSSNRHPA